MKARRRNDGVCARAHSDKWFETIVCQNESIKDVASNWRACASKVGVDATAIEAVEKCTTTKEGADLLRKSFARSKARGVTASPTVFIAGQPYDGLRASRAFLAQVCHGFSTDKPAACSMPIPPPVRVTVLTDRLCDGCVTGGEWGTVLESRIDPHLVKFVDYGSAEGKALYASLAPVTLPVMVFEGSFSDDDEAAKWFDAAATKGDHRVLVEGDWHPECGPDGACELAACKGQPVCAH